jgi:hypothetical protein
VEEVGADLRRFSPAERAEDEVPPRVRYRIQAVRATDATSSWDGVVDGGSEQRTTVRVNPLHSAEQAFGTERHNNRTRCRPATGHRGSTAAFGLTVDARCINHTTETPVRSNL